MQQTSQINWLSILRGITIVLVLTYHVRLLNTSTGECYQWILDIGQWFKPFRMPTFVMVSGALLFYTRISKAWSVKALYKDKFIRIGLPLLFCTCLGNVLQIIFNGYVKTPHEVTIASFFRSFIEYNSSPWPHRWYLMVLLIMMMLYPVYRLILRSKIATVAVLVLLFALEPFDFYKLVETNWLYFFALNKYLPYFFLGIVLFRYRWYTLLNNAFFVPLLWCGYVLLYNCSYNDYLSLPTSVVGISAMISTAMLADRYIPSLCSSFRKYIFQIYLFGIVFQAFVELILWKMFGCPDSYVAIFYVLNMLAGIYMPVLISKMVERIPNRTLRLCFGLK